MRISKLKKLLNLWENNGLINSEQNKNISEFMKERNKNQFFRLIKWLFIIGAFWVFFGVISSIVQFFDLSFMEHIKEILFKVWLTVTRPILDFLSKLFPGRCDTFIYGVTAIVLSLIPFQIVRKGFSLLPDKIVEKLNLSEQQKGILKGNNIWIDIIGCLLLSTGFMLFNVLLIPAGTNQFDTISKVFPLWYLIGTIAFFVMAYRFSKVLYLIFGIYFLSLTVGMFSGYEFACYWIGASRPVVQALVGFILILVGYINETKIKKDDELKEQFAQTYNWTGLLIMFIALWIMSFWGFDLGLDDGNYKFSPAAWEIWLANIIFIGTTIWAMCYGAKKEHKLFFDYGLVFLIIESYTIFCSRIWDKFPYAISSLLFGIMLIFTGILLAKTYVKKQK